LAIDNNTAVSLFMYHWDKISTSESPVKLLSSEVNYP